MKTASAKAKGRKLQQTIAKKIGEILPCGASVGKDCLIESREMGQSGTDIKLYGVAKEQFPFAVECKNTERFNMYKAIEQAKENKTVDTDWLVVHKKNRSNPVVILDAEVFFDVYEQYLQQVYSYR